MNPPVLSAFVRLLCAGKVCSAVLQECRARREQTG